ncbi:MAG: tol-pal system protein YbgF [Alphaproteobacteria bacterium]|nr:tol-pal system protein YbgF [Alphaproteobacteria bacterium]
MKKIILSCFIFSSFISLSALAELKVDLLSEKVTRIENDLSALQRKVYQTKETPILLPADNTASTVVEGNLEDLYSRLSAQDQVVKDLTAKMEQIEFNQKQLEEKFNKMNADLDVRFNMLSTEKSSSLAGVSTSKTGDKEAYDAAYNIMKKGDYKKAEEAFTLFMKEYPNSTLVGNANYWLGETYYARGLFEQAVGIFADGFTKYKNNSKAADNLLKLGLTMNKLNKKEEACTAFKSLGTEFPKADQKLKERAKAEAKKLQCK